MRKKSQENENNDVRVLLHNIRSAHNVGSIFRTADAVGVSHIYLSGYTPCPIDRFARPSKEIAKTALGAERSILWEYASHPEKWISELKQQGFTVVGIEQDDRAIDYKQYRTNDKTLVLVGNEVRGLSRGIRDRCDVLLEIPMKGKKESLNVSVSFGVALFRFFDR